MTFYVEGSRESRKRSTRAKRRNVPYPENSTTRGTLHLHAPLQVESLWNRLGVLYKIFPSRHGVQAREKSVYKQVTSDSSSVGFHHRKSQGSISQSVADKWHQGRMGDPLKRRNIVESPPTLDSIVVIIHVAPHGGISQSLYVTTNHHSLTLLVSPDAVQYVTTTTSTFIYIPSSPSDRGSTGRRGRRSGGPVRLYYVLD